MGVLLATVAAIVVAFVLLSPGGDDEQESASTATTAAPPAPVTTPATTPAVPESPPPPPAPTFTTIRVEAGKPVGGVKTITVKKGERARIAVRSPDTSDEIHVHGYDLSRDLKAGGSVRLSFAADAEGIFEIELESAGTQIGKLIVEP